MSGVSQVQVLGLARVNASHAHAEVADVCDRQWEHAEPRRNQNQALVSNTVFDSVSVFRRNVRGFWLPHGDVLWGRSYDPVFMTGVAAANNRVMSQEMHC